MVKTPAPGHSGMNIGARLFFIAVATSSVYVFPSGNPQPADFLLMLASAMILMRQIPWIRGLRLLWPMVALTIWVVAVSAVWTALHPEGSFYRYPLFFIFNLIVMVTVVNLYSRLNDPNRFFTRATELALLVSGLGVILSVVAPGVLLASESARIAGFFNNPNQLAYFSLCMMGVILVLQEGRIVYHPLTLGALMSGVLGIFAAASLGAMAGSAFLVLAFLAANWKRSMRILKALGIALVVAVLAFGFDIYTEGAMIDRIQTRADRLEVKIDAVETERGYHRIIAHPEYLVFGAGEGSLERFPGYGTLEIHSSLGTLLFSYGVVGIALFLLLFLRALRNAPVYVWLIMAAPLTYSLTHMGLRGTSFWFLIVVVTVMYGKRWKTGRKANLNRPQWDMELVSRVTR
jgi:hypothetical protein